MIGSFRRLRCGWRRDEGAAELAERLELVGVERPGHRGRDVPGVGAADAALGLGARGR